MKTRKAYIETVIVEQGKVVLFLRLAGGRRLRFEAVSPAAEFPEALAHDIREQI